jgi:putative oxidoreductase
MILISTYTITVGLGMDQDGWLLVARICVAAVYLYSGIDKIVNWAWSIAFIKGLRLPQAPIVLTGTIVTQLLGSAAILLGFYAPEGAGLLLIFTLVATAVAHNPIGLKGEEFRRQIMLSLEHLAIVGGLLLIAVVGPGSYAMRP